MKFGLHGISALLNYVGNPQQQFPAVHIAGTNGKGSTAAMIAAICTAAGYKTGLYTSPHILRFEERIRINGNPISPRTVAQYTTKIQPFIEEHRLTFFEAVTALAFRYFAEENVDVAVVETGLGGRLDATNVLVPVVSIITTIGFDHTHILGKTLQSIAREKAGIIKQNVPIITGENKKQALSVIKEVAKKKKAPLVLVKPQYCVLDSQSLSGSILHYNSQRGCFRSLTLELAGLYQGYNAALAIETCLTLAERGEFTFKEHHIRKGLLHVQRYSGFYGRLMVLQKKPLVVLDVAHNPDAIRALVESLRSFGFSKMRIVFGAMVDKDIPQMAKLLQSLCHEVIAVAPKTGRAASTTMIAGEFMRHGVQVTEASSVARGVKKALERRDGIPALITGSHFVCAEAYAWYTGKKYLTINQ